MTSFWKLILGYCLVCIFTTANAAELRLGGRDELRFAGRSAQEAFDNDDVANLLRAAISLNINEAQNLVSTGVNINAVGKDGATPLIWLLGLQNLGGVKLLLNLGANPNQYVQDGVGPPVWLSAGGGKKEALRLLLDHGGDPNLSYGTKSPLMMAISGSHIECAELLLQRGADINFENGISALDMALLHVQFDDVVWVLEHGYTYNLLMAKRMITRKNPRLGQEELKVKALEIVNRLLAIQ